MAKKITSRLLKCACCNKLIAEYFTDARYPKGAIKIISRHGTEKHESVIDPARPAEAPRANP